VRAPARNHPKQTPPTSLTAVSARGRADQRHSADSARRIMQTSRIVVGLKDRSLLNDTGISCVQRPRSLLPMALFWSRSPRCPRRFSFAACQNVGEINGYSPVRALHRGRGYFPGKLPEFWRKHVDSSSQVTHSTARLRGIC
jgi:hypothetical protein